MSKENNRSYRYYIVIFIIFIILILQAILAWITFQDDLVKIKMISMDVGSLLSCMLGIWLIIKINLIKKEENFLLKKNLLILIGGIFLFNGLGQLVYTFGNSSEYSNILDEIKEILWNLAHFSILSFAFFYFVYIRNKEEKRFRDYFIQIYICICFIISIVYILLIIFNLQKIQEQFHVHLMHISFSIFAIMCIVTWIISIDNDKFRLSCTLLFSAFITHEALRKSIPDYSNFLVEEPFYYVRFSFYLYLIFFILMISFIIINFLWRNEKSEISKEEKIEFLIISISIILYILSAITIEKFGSIIYEIVWTFCRPLLVVFGILFIDLFDIHIPDIISIYVIAITSLEVIITFIEFLIIDYFYISIIFCFVIVTINIFLKSFSTVLLNIDEENYWVRLNKIKFEDIKKEISNLFNNERERIKITLMVILTLLIPNLFKLARTEFYSFLFFTLILGLGPIIDQIFQLYDKFKKKKIKKKNI